VRDIQKLKHIQQDNNVPRFGNLMDIISIRLSKTYISFLFKNIFPTLLGSGEKNQSIKMLFVDKKLKI
jgi:hypothetical protein